MDDQPFMNSVLQTLGKKLGRMCNRWDDESKYEDFNVYARVLCKMVRCQGFDYVNCTKKPFGVVFKHHEAKYHLHATKTQISIANVS